MTLSEFGALIATVDPKADHYFSNDSGSFTVWQEYGRVDEYANGQNQGGWKIQVERYTTMEYDPIAAALEQLLTGRDDMAFEYMVDTEREGEGVTIRHLFDGVIT